MIITLEVSLISVEYCTDLVTNFTEFGVELKTHASEGTAILMRRDTIYTRSCLLVSSNMEIITTVLDPKKNRNTEEIDCNI